MPDGSIRHLNANHLRPYTFPVNEIGIVFENDCDGFVDIVCCDSALKV